jgi:hypothetical protein
MFSYGCLCHVSLEGIREYAVNIYPKLKRGSNCFWMVADHDKYNSAVSNLNDLSILTAMIPRSRMYLPLKWLSRYLVRRIGPASIAEQPQPSKWYNAGIERTCSMLKEVGYHIVDHDVGTCLRDPVIHFIKP